MNFTIFKNRENDIKFFHKTFNNELSKDDNLSTIIFLMSQVKLKTEKKRTKKILIPSLHYLSMSVY